MNNLPLQPLVWVEISEKVRNDPSICELDKGALWITDDNLVFRYNIKNNPDSKELPFIVNYGGRQPKEVDSVEYGKHWAEFTHYASQMQPYVKPSPTWIDVSERLPKEDGLYLTLRKGFTFEMGNESDLVPKVSGWNGGRGCFDDDFGNVLFTHWMPLPELPISKESDCE